MLLICKLNDCTNGQTDFITEMINAAEISGQDLEFILRFTKAVLTLNKDFMMESMQLCPKNIDIASFEYYMRLMGEDAHAVFMTTSMEKIKEITFFSENNVFTTSFVLDEKNEHEFD